MSLVDILDKVMVIYYPEKDYFPCESYYKNLHIDTRVGMRQNNNIVDVKNATEIWVFIIKKKYINNNFFSDIRNLDLKNLVFLNPVLPLNIISAKYYNSLDENKNLSYGL
jgi:hypothetical protein